jgi:putative salt-induced outer membrane protein
MTALLALLQAAAPAPAATLPADARAVLQAAIDSGDSAAVETVARFVGQAHPGAAAEIAAMRTAFAAAHAERAAAAEAARRRALAEAGPAENWDGSFEVGGSRSTGSSSSLGLFGAVSGTRTGLDWSHRVSARAEIQETNGARTAERLSASWQPRRSLGAQLYGFGLAEYERDPFLGIDSRFTGGLGAGYSFRAGEAFRVELEGGPSVRRTDPREGVPVSTLGGRASLDATWRISPSLELKQNGSLVFDEENGTGRATTALDAALFGPLRMRLSYELRYERDVLRDLGSLDTTSRATLVFGF